MSAELPSTGATRDSLGERRSPQEIRRRCELLFERAGVQFAPYEHEPVLDYETAALIRERFGLVGAETKALFLRGKTGRFIMFVSQEGQRLDRNRSQEALGEKASVASQEELQRETGCAPGCAVPFGLPPHIVLLVDPALDEIDSLIFSPGPPTETLQVESDEWGRLLAAVDNPVVRY